MMKTTEDRSSLHNTSEPIIEYHILTEEYREESQRQVCQALLSEPSTVALNETHPKMKIDFQDWMEFTGHYMDHCCTNGLSVVAKDKSNNLVVGTFLAKDFHLHKPELAEIYSNPDLGISAIFEFMARMDKAAIELRPELGEKSVRTYEGLLIGIHPDYRRHNVALNLGLKGEWLAKKAGYHYSIGIASNAYSRQIMRANGGECLVEEKTSELMFNGEAVFKNTKPPHGLWSLWLKDIQLAQLPPCDTIL